MALSWPKRLPTNYNRPLNVSVHTIYNMGKTMTRPGKQNHQGDLSRLPKIEGKHKHKPQNNKQNLHAVPECKMAFHRKIVGDSG